MVPGTNWIAARSADRSARDEPLDASGQAWATDLESRRRGDGGVQMATAEAVPRTLDQDEPWLRWGSWLMGLAAVGFIGYGVIFFIRNFTDSFLELGIGPNEVNVGKDQIVQFSPSLYQYISHLQIALSGFIAATGLAVLFLVAFSVRGGRGGAWCGCFASPVRGPAWAPRTGDANHFDTLGHLGLI